MLKRSRNLARAMATTRKGSFQLHPSLAASLQGRKKKDRSTATCWTKVTSSSQRRVVASRNPDRSLTASVQPSRVAGSVNPYSPYVLTQAVNPQQRQAVPNGQNGPWQGPPPGCVPPAPGAVAQPVPGAAAVAQPGVAVVPLGARLVPPPPIPIFPSHPYAHGPRDYFMLA